MRTKEAKELVLKLKTAEDNMRWLVENYDNLKAKYGDTWVAVRDRRVLAHDKDYERLLKVVAEMGLSDEITVDFISTVPPNFLL